MAIEIDRIDKQLLRLLQRDARLSNLELADKVGLSPTPCLRRVKRLYDSGLIQKQVAILDPDKLGLHLTAHIAISMDRHIPDRFDRFEEAVKAMPEIIECSIVTGQDADFLLKVLVSDMRHYEQFLLGKLTKLDGVTGVHSSFVLRKVVEHTELPLTS